MTHKNRILVIGVFQFVVSLLLALATTGVAVAQSPVPLINQPVVPDAAKPGGAAFTLTVNGTGFVSGSAVKWNGSPRITTFVSRSRLKATILASDIAAPRTALVTVINPSPGGGTSNVAFFEITPSSSSIALARTDYGTGNYSQSVAIGDFNGDGKLDLAVAEYDTNTVGVLLGKGNGTFQAQVEYPTGSSPDAVAVGDFNGDGKLDLAVANGCTNCPFGGSVSILLGNGNGTFQTQVVYATGNNPGAIALGDFNGDGKLDFAVVNSSDSTVGVLLGNGDGTFQTQVTYAIGATGCCGGSVGVGDFDKDGNLDLVAGAGVGVSVLLGNGDGTFQGHVDYSGGGAGVGDFNGDGKLDLTGGASVLLGNGDGTFGAPISTGVVGGPVALGDFNGDGKLDLAVANDSNGNTVALLFGNGDGTFKAAVNYATASFPSTVVAGDFNRDGRIDLAVDALDVVSVLLQAPTISLSKTSETFVDQLVGTRSASQTATLSNTSALTINIGSITVAGVNAADFGQTNNCGRGVPPGGKCQITVTFTPTRVGPGIASVTISDNAMGSPHQIALSGTGVVSGPNATLSPSNLTFATQVVGTTSPAQPVTLSDYGTAALNITNKGLTGADPGDFHQTNTCGITLAPGASCTMNVTFKPTQVGSRTASLSITDHAPGSPQAVSLTGPGTVVEFTPTNLSFGAHRVGNAHTLTTTLTNVGSRTLNVSSIRITGTDSDEFSQTNNCDSSVGAGKSCTITVTFKPTEVGGDSANVSVSDNGGGSPQQVPLSGSGCGGKHCAASRDSSAVRSALAKFGTAVAPKPTGLNPVGTRIMDLTDSTRNEIFLPSGAKRELLVRFWYPTSADQGCKLVEYTSPRVWNYFSELTRLPLPQVTTNSCLDAPIANGVYPVVVFTHGYTGTFTDYTFLFEDLASRGYVVASIDHTYEATAVEFPDGRFVQSVVGSHLANTWRIDDQSLSFALSVRLDDLRFVLNELERLNTWADNPFAAKLDITKVALAGHSLGGLAAWHGVQQDTRFKAGILLDPYLVNVLSEPTETPVMLLTMGHEQRSEEECRLWSDLLGPRFSVNLHGAEHVTPSDAVWLAKGAIKAGAMGPDKAIAAVRDYVAAFLDTNLRGERSVRLLTGPSSSYPDAVVTMPQDSICKGGTR